MKRTSNIYIAALQIGKYWGKIVVSAAAGAALGKAVVLTISNSTLLIKIWTVIHTGLKKEILNIRDDLFTCYKNVVPNNMDTLPSLDTYFVSSCLEYGDLKSPLERIIYNLYLSNVYLFLLVLFIILIQLLFYFV